MATFTGADKAIGFLFDMVGNIANDYDSASTYVLDAYAIYEGTLYKCINPISTPEDFTPAHWHAVLIMDEVAAGGGGGGGTTVIANPAGSATDTLNKLQVGSTIYDIPSGGGSGESYSTSEQIIGTWTDGRSVYRRVYQFSPRINLNAQSWNTTPISNTGMSLVLRATIMDLNGTHWEVGASCRTGNYMEFFNLRNGAVNNVEHAIIEYVKTT